GSVTNSATVSETEFDSNPANNTASTTTIVYPPGTADLALTDSGSQNPVPPVGSLTYTLTVTDNGPADSTGVSLTDTLAGTAGFVAATPSQGTCGQSSGTVTCALGGLASGASATVAVVVTAPSAQGAIANSASVTADQTDPNSANNSATVNTSVSYT